MSNSLVYSTYVQKETDEGKSILAGEIRLFKGRNPGETLREREGQIEHLLVHDGRLFDSGLYDKVFETFTNNTVAYRQQEYGCGQLIVHEGKLGCIFTDDMAVREIGVSAGSPALAVMAAPIGIGHVHSHEGNLYAVGFNGSCFNLMMRSLSPDRCREKNIDPVVWVLPFSAKKLFSDGKKLYAIGSTDGNDGVIFDVFDGSILARRPKGIETVVLHNGEWYDGGFYEEIKGSFSDKTIDAPYHVRGMHSHEGRLYAWGIDGLYDVLNGQKLSDDNINAMATIPSSLLQTEIEGFDPKEQLLEWAKNMSSKLKSLIPDKKDNPSPNNIPPHTLN